MDRGSEFWQILGGRLTSWISPINITVVGLPPRGSDRHHKGKNPVNAYVDMKDYVENIFGIVVGTGLYRLVQGALQARYRKPQCAIQPMSQSTLREPDVAAP